MHFKEINKNPINHIPSTIKTQLTKTMNKYHNHIKPLNP